MKIDEVLAKKYLLNSDLKGYYLRLKRLEYVLIKCIKKDTRLIYTFQCGDYKPTVLKLYIGKRNYRLLIKKNNDVRLDVSKPCWTRLEKPFLKYFNETKPLQLRRLLDSARTFSFKSRQRKGIQRKQK